MNDRVSVAQLAFCARNPDRAAVRSEPDRRPGAWETTRYHAYQTHLAGRTIGETFSLTTAFLKLTAASAGPIADTSVPGQQANLTRSSDTAAT